MNKNYTIEWRNPAKTILEIKYLGDAVLNDILSSNVDSFSMIETVPHEVLLIHNGQGYNVELGLLSVGQGPRLGVQQIPTRSKKPEIRGHHLESTCHPRHDGLRLGNFG